MYSKICVGIFISLFISIGIVNSQTSRENVDLFELFDIGKNMTTESEKLEKVTQTLLESKELNHEVLTLMALTKESQRFSLTFHYNLLTILGLYYDLPNDELKIKAKDLVLTSLNFSIESIKGAIDSFYQAKSVLNRRSLSDIFENIIINLQQSYSILKKYKNEIEKVD